MNECPTTLYYENYISYWVSKQVFYRKEGDVSLNDILNTFYFTVIWRRTYGKGPLR